MRSTRTPALALLAGLLAVACSSASSPEGASDLAGPAGADPGFVRAPNTRDPDPVVGVQLANVPAPRESRAPGASDPTRAVVAKVTLSKAAILGADKTFLYGADLQYSAERDSGYELILQSLALGHDVVRFRIVNDQLQMVADQTYLFESNVNHPERLVHAFPILDQTSSTVTIEVAHGSPTLAPTIGGGSAGKERTSWVRDVQYARSDKLLMFATSIESATGGVYEFLESVFPRENLVPKTGWNPILADAGREALAERYRFLTWGSVFLDLEGERAQTQVAVRYDVKRGKTIDWWVTPNVPAEHENDVRTAIEGWNRYSRAMWGADFVRFRGKLPAGVHLGDPRYNVVNWDSVADAGAAYESQASDPTTGIQSHSLIYMPYAWVNIGLDYWQRGELSEARSPGAAAARVKKALGARTFLGRRIAVSCLRDDDGAQIALQARQTPEDFAKELLKGTLFHEVGHALGLAHNFKGSTSTTQYSSSVMDYNQYNLDRGAFYSTAGWDGPLLEYDRQILSALYNESHDVKDTDAVMPACDDGEADDLSAGVDPFCVRYDAGVDPTQRTLETIALVTDPAKQLGTMRSLPAALRAAAAELPAAGTIANVKDAKAALDKYATSIRGVAGFYFTSGAGSIRYMASITVPTLYKHRAFEAPAGFDAAQARTRTWQAVEFAANAEKLPAATSAALDDAVRAAEQWLGRTAAILAVPQSTRTQEVDAAMGSVRALRERLEGTNETSTLTGLRRRVVGALLRVSTSPFAFTSSPVRLDYEEKAIALLERGLTTKIGTATRPFNERMDYAAALSTFKDTDAGVAAAGRARAVVEAELAAARDETEREALRTLLNAI